jgi:glycerophosphoryl diester phosphodiesterase
MIKFDLWDKDLVSHDAAKVSSKTPTLPEVLAVIRGRSQVNIEFKDPSQVERAMVHIKQALSLGIFAQEQIILSSFHHGSMIRAKRSYPLMRVGVICDSVLPNFYLEHLHANGVESLHVHLPNAVMDMKCGSAMKRAADRLGMRIWVWTVNFPTDFEIARRYGAEAVFTDFPHTLGLRS